MARSDHRWWSWWGDLIRDFGPTFAAQGLMAPEEHRALEQAWARYTGTPDAFFYTPVLLQVVAGKR